MILAVVSEISENFLYPARPWFLQLWPFLDCVSILGARNLNYSLSQGQCQLQRIVLVSGQRHKSDSDSRLSGPLSLERETLRLDWVYLRDTQDTVGDCDIADCSVPVADSQSRRLVLPESPVGDSATVIGDSQLSIITVDNYRCQILAPSQAPGSDGPDRSSGQVASRRHHSRRLETIRVPWYSDSRLSIPQSRENCTIAVFSRLARGTQSGVICFYRQIAPSYLAWIFFRKFMQGKVNFPPFGGKIIPNLPLKRQIWGILKGLYIV